LTASLAVLTASLYVFTHNLWLCIALHFGLRVVILQLVRRGTSPPVLAEERSATSA